MIHPPSDGLDAESREMLRRIESEPFLDPATMTPDEMRRGFDAFYAKVDLAPAPVQARDMAFAGPAGEIGVRLYRPEGAEGNLPSVLFCKGGGLMMGTLDSYDAIARRLCHASGAAVVSVAYRQPPEHRFPAALDDCLAALDWMHGQAAALDIDPSRLAVAGDSGGGALAAAVAQATVGTRGPRLSAQALAYPALGRGPDSASMREFARGYWFEPEAMDWLYGQYVSKPEDMQDPRLQPALRADLSGLPPTYLCIAEYDILRDDGLGYARRLREAGVPVEMDRYAHTIHGFLNMGGVIPYVGEAIDRAGAFLARALAAG